MGDPLQRSYSAKALSTKVTLFTCDLSPFKIILDEKKEFLLSLQRKVFAKEKWRRNQINLVQKGIRMSRVRVQSPKPEIKANPSQIKEAHKFKDFLATSSLIVKMKSQRLEKASPYIFDPSAFTKKKFPKIQFTPRKSDFELEPFKKSLSRLRTKRDSIDEAILKSSSRRPSDDTPRTIRAFLTPRESRSAMKTSINSISRISNCF